MLSPESQKLFKDAIVISGTAEHFWSISEQNDHLQRMYNIAREMKQPKQTYEELVDFLKTVDPIELVRHSVSTVDPFDRTFVPNWNIVIES